MAYSGDGSTSIKVLVRVRPLLARELQIQEEDSTIKECLISMPPQDKTKTKLKVPKTSAYHSQKTKLITRPDSPTNDEVKEYRFDESIWSFNKDDPNYTDNKQFYNKTGPEIIDHLFQGFNVCLLAYGQTSSGKTYTMMGNDEEQGLIPLIIRDILRHKERLVNERINCELKVSYMEIYNEQVKDLLGNDRTALGPDKESVEKKCRVREHPTMGPYVENLNEVQINSFQDFKARLAKGNANRSTASTSMNDKSSRSHAILTLSLKQTKFTQSDMENSMNIGDAEEEMISNIKLVDLAGSERLAKTKVYGQHDRMKEGTLINKSLTVLGRCIHLLSNNSSNPNNKLSIVPYRDSILTYILKENLAGNSKSFMIFCISPIDFEETYQTLNYANQVKKIKTAAKANKTKLSATSVDWKELQRTDQDVIDSLKEEIKELTAKLDSMKDISPQPSHLSEEKFNKLITFLEKETEKVKFENKFLKQKLLQKSNQINELNTYINFMDHQFINLNNDFRALKQQAATNILEKCHINYKSLDYELEELDPSRIFNRSV